jgi:hypothetical protein
MWPMLPSTLITFVALDFGIPDITGIHPPNCLGVCNSHTFGLIFRLAPKLLKFLRNADIPETEPRRSGTLGVTAM